jgi:hypothetical protein
MSRRLASMFNPVSLSKLGEDEPKQEAGLHVSLTNLTSLHSSHLAGRRTSESYLLINSIVLT